MRIIKSQISELKDFLKYDPDSAISNAGQGNEYYARVAYRYGYAKKLLCIILLAAILVFLLMGTVSYDSFYYLSRDFGVAFDYVNSGYESITYSIGDSQAFAMYHGGLAVASREGISIYSAGGRELFSASHQYGNPRLRTSSKYALLYDNGGKKYSLYNSFSMVKEETLEYPIRDARIAPSGEYLISTSSEKYTSVIKVYSGNGKVYDYNFLSSHITSVDISQDGARIALCVSEGDADSVKTEIRIYNVGSSEFRSVKTGFSGIPYGISFLDNGGISVISSEGINVFSSSLQLLGEYYTENDVYCYSVSEYASVLVHTDEKTLKNKIIMFDKKGNISYNNIIAEKVLDVRMSGEYLFVQTPGGFFKINTSRQGDIKEIKLVTSDFKMLICDSERILICGSSYARFIEFKEAK